jgi:hypothetical protein
MNFECEFFSFRYLEDWWQKMTWLKKLFAVWV